ncbi:lipocalin family protein [Ferruginibacter albus]|uniref:lipocalin family protein n=1 Tax=Ferruginibacter albus TaxID=2875540 RepID=UPI001CC3CF70|nr:lipocalin family protein [Ferruginibacter albus]UAY50874.1 hypothetical protein K9M53_09760 [Ferruginibacter albus]
MKKILFVSSLVLISGVFLVSCSKDNATSDPGALVGTWRPVSAHAVEVDSTISNNQNITDSTYSANAGTITFKSDGTYSLSDPNGDPPSTEVGTYTTANGKISTVPTSYTGDPGIPVEDASFSVSGNALTLVQTLSVPGFFSATATMHLVKVN